jgi:rhodanese-related sulfurtransferase
MPVTVKDLLDAANAAVPKVTPDEARALMAQGALVVDVRDGTEVAASGKVKGAVHAQRGLIEFKADSAMPSHDPAFQKDRVVIVYCASGGRSALAGKTLKDMGFADVRNLGGFKGWVDSGGEIERS